MGHVHRPTPATPEPPVRRLLLVVALVLVVTVGYRSLGGEETGTGTLTVAQPWPNPEEEVPSFEAERLDGGTFGMSDEGTYVLSFWSGLNRGTSLAHPDFERLAREYGGPETTFAAVYVGGVPQFDRDAPYAVIQDSSGELSSMYNVKRVPRLFLIEDGEVRLAQDGFYEDNERDLERELKEMGNENAR